MKKGLTELVFILDKSGSMGGLESDTIGGFNSMLDKQKVIDGDCYITTALFDNNYELLHDRIDIRAVSPITGNDYQVGGSTALIDAIGRTIKKIKNAQEHTATNYRAENVIFVIITDGMENASREYTSDMVKNQISLLKERDKWEFIFLGANIDSVETARHFGIGSDRAINYIADKKGTEINFETMNKACSYFRDTGEIGKSCFDEIREDFVDRSKF